MSLSTETSFPVCRDEPTTVQLLDFSCSDGANPHLQQSRDRVRRDAPVRIGDQVLHIQIARCDRGRMSHGHLVEGFDCREFEG